MSMPDLATMKAPDPVAESWDSYEDGNSGQQRAALPKKGVYTVTTFDAPEIGTTNDGYLRLGLGDLIVDKPGTPEHGAVVKFTRISTKKFANRNGSFVFDYLRAHHWPTVPKTNEEVVAAAQALVGRPFLAKLDLEARCNACQTNLHKGYESIPKGADGEPVSYVTCPTCGPEKRVWVNARVVAFINPDALTPRTNGNGQ